MADFEPIPVVGLRGQPGTLLDPPLHDDPNAPVRILWEDGSVMEVHPSLLQRNSDGTLRIALAPTHAMEAQRREAGLSEPVVIPVLAEELVVDKERVPTGGVRVHRRIETHEERIALPLLREHVDVRRVPIDRVVEGPLPVRREGDTTIVPVVEEVLVTRTEFRLKEEIRITRTTTRDHHSETVTLRQQRAEVEKLTEDGQAKPVEQPFIRDENMLRRRGG